MRTNSVGRKPTIFVASSSERLKTALAVKRMLARHADTTVWNQNVLQPTEHPLESLLKQAEQSQFGIFILGPDDFAQIRDKKVRVARDNVLFELGLFIGYRGRDRCFMLVQSSGETFKLPSDLAGITLIPIAPGTSKKHLSEPRHQIVKALSERKNRLPQSAIDVISQILQATARFIALRAQLDEKEVRGFCHIFDYQDKCLRPVTSYTASRVHLDKRLDIPCSGSKFDDWYIISRSFRTNRYCCAEVDWKADLRKIPYSRDIWGDLRSVVAHPIRPSEGRALPIGTLAFDSSRRLADLGWDRDRDLEDILATLAATIHAVITRIR